MSPDRTEDLRAHLEEIAQAHGIEIIWRRSTIGGLAHRPQRRVWISIPTTPLRYLIGLHELGHCIAPRAYWGRMIEREAVAWAWAFKEARLPLTPRVRRAVKARLDGYLEYGPAQWGAKLPSDDSPFWRFYNDL